jgi:DNA invertase Pin-like site-specific DNA recombinase
MPWVKGQSGNPPAGKAMFQMTGVFAEFERAMIAERVRAGLARARSEGRRLGRPRRLPSHLKNESVRPWRLLGGPVCASLPNGLA